MRREGYFTALTVFFLLAVAPTLANHCAAPAGCTAGATTVCGVEICGVCYHCNSAAADNVCPANYGSGTSCGICDVDCIKGTAAQENSLAMCNDCGDNDADGLANFADATPSPFVNPTGSCNECSVSACVSAGFTDTVLVDGNAQASTTGVVYSDGTAVRGGDGSAKRLDSDGTGGAGRCWCGACDLENGYYWNANTGTCVQDAKACVITAAPVITSFTASPASGYDKFATTLILQGTVGAGLTGTYQIDTNEDNTAYEYTDYASPTSTAVNNLGVATHRYYAKLTDNCLPRPRTVTTYVDVPVAPNTNPWITITSTNPVAGKLSDVNIATRLRENQGPTSTRIIIRNSSSQVEVDTTQSTVGTGSVDTTYNIRRMFHVGTYSIDVSATDGGNPQLSSTNTSSFNVPCVIGTQTGNRTYDDLASQCCSNSCAQTINGGVYCFAGSACYPDGNTICEGPAAPSAQWRDRDYSQTVCEAPSATCSMYRWSSIDGECCMDTGDGNDAYYTGNEENTPITCSDGFDNDCDGIKDRQEASCYAASVSGTVKFYNERTGVVEESATTTANTNVNTQIWISDDSLPITLPGYSTNYAFNNATYKNAVAGREGLWIGQPSRKITVSRSGYKTQVSSAITLASGGSYSVNFTLQPRRCDRFCMNDEGFCDISCIGVGECQPTGASVSQPNETLTELGVLKACHPKGAAFGLRSGTEVVMGSNSTDLLVGVCCSVPPQWRRAPAVTAQENLNIDKISTLVKFTRLVTLNGRTYKLVISTWDS